MQYSIICAFNILYISYVFMMYYLAKFWCHLPEDFEIIEPKHVGAM